MTGTSNDLRRTGGDETISHATGTFDSPQALTTGTWGYAIPSGTEHIVANHFDTAYVTQESAYPASTKFAAPPISTASAQLITSTSSANETEDDEPIPDEISIYYGVNADNTTTLGTYTNSVLLTAVADAAETASASVSPNSGSTLGGETITVATTLYATNDVDADIYMLTNTQYADVSTTPANISNYSSAKMTCTKTAATAVTYTCTTPANTAGNNYHVYVDIPRYDRQYSASFSYVIPSFTVTVTGTNTSVGASSLSIPYGGSKTVTVTPNSGYYLSAVSCPSGYTCTGYSTGSTQTGTQTITITNNNTASGGTLTVTSTLIPAFYRISNMQEMTSTICNNTAVGTSKTLTDTRDNKTYTVKKLNMNNGSTTYGACWMTQNLRLVGPISAANLNSTNTDVAPGSTFALTASNSGTWCLSWDSSCINQSLMLDSGSNSYGAYYNWYAATAGTGKYETTSGNTSGSICPKGWKLPKGGSSGDFQYLYNAYNSYANMTTNASGPQFVRAGSRWTNSIEYQNVEGYYWASTATSDSNANALYLSSAITRVYADDKNNKMIGESVRCIAQ